MSESGSNIGPPLEDESITVIVDLYRLSRRDSLLIAAVALTALAGVLAVWWIT